MAIFKVLFAYSRTLWSEEDNIITFHVALAVAELAPNQLRINPARNPRTPHCN
jgi:hypothetical protein